MIFKEDLVKIMFLVLVMSLLSGRVFSELELTGNSESVLGKCITTICDRYEKVNKLVMKGDYNVVVNNRILVDDLEKLHLKDVHEKIDLFVMFIENGSDFRNILDGFVSFPNWNAASKILVVFPKGEHLQELFEEAWSKFVVNINVLILEEDVTSIYTYFPYDNQNCESKIQPVLANNCEEDTKDFFPNKVPNNLHKCEIKMIVRELPPYVLDYKSKEDKVEKIGLDVMIMRQIAKKMNFTEKYIQHNFTDWGGVNSDGTYTKMYRIIFQRRADVMYGMVHMNSNKMLHFDGSIVYALEGMTWWVPTAAKIPDWIKLLRIFKPVVWSAIFFMLGLHGICFYLFGKRETRGSIFHEISACFLTSWCILLQFSTWRPKTGLLRMILAGWSLLSLLVYTAYQSQLINLFKKTIYQDQISTVNELLNSKLKYGFYSIVLDYYQYDDSETSAIILKNHIPCPLSEECLNRTAFQRDFAVIKNVRQTTYLAKKYYLSEEGKPLLYGFKDMMHLTPRFVTLKGYPLLPKFNKVLLALQANGLIAKWDKTWSQRSTSDDGSQWSPLSIKHVLTGVVFLFIGYSISVVVFVFEAVWKYKKIPK